MLRTFVFYSDNFNPVERMLLPARARIWVSFNEFGSGLMLPVVEK